MDDVILDSMRAERLQWSFDVLNNLLDQVSLRTDYGKMVSLVCQPCQYVVRHSAEAYGRRMTGVGMPYHNHQLIHVWFPWCKLYLAEISMKSQ